MAKWTSAPRLKVSRGSGLLVAGVLGEAGHPVLLDGVLDRLLELALQLHRDDGDAVQEEHEIDAPRLGLGAGLGEVGLGGVGAVDQLGHHAQDVAFVHGLRLRVQTMVGLELAELEGGRLVAKLVAQHAQGAEGAQTLVRRVGVGLAQLGGELSDERLLRVAAVELLVLRPGLRLGRLDVGEAVRGVERPLSVVFGRVAELPAAPDHLVDDVLLEGGFFGFRAHATSASVSDWGVSQRRTSILPVTAAEMSAARRSLKSSPC